MKNWINKDNELLFVFAALFFSLFLFVSFCIFLDTQGQRPYEKFDDCLYSQAKHLKILDNRIDYLQKLLEDR